MTYYYVQELEKLRKTDTTDPSDVQIKHETQRADSNLRWRVQGWGLYEQRMDARTVWTKITTVDMVRLVQRQKHDEIDRPYDLLRAPLPYEIAAAEPRNWDTEDRNWDPILIRLISARHQKFVIICSSTVYKARVYSRVA